MENLEDRIERTYDLAMDCRRSMETALRSMRESEQRVKSENREEYLGAKNGETRSFMLAEWLAGDEDYETAKKDYEESRLGLRLNTLDAERLKLLVLNNSNNNGSPR